MLVAHLLLCNAAGEWGRDAALGQYGLLGTDFCCGLFHGRLRQVEFELANRVQFGQPTVGFVGVFCAVQLGARLLQHGLLH
ncbi:hypothetical protein D3C81_1982590 [compost metagenome]